jgi:hypothetical protein
MDLSSYRRQNKHATDNSKATLTKNQQINVIVDYLSSSVDTDVNVNERMSEKIRDGRNAFVQSGQGIQTDGS